MSPSFCTFFAELHCGDLKGKEAVEVCMCVCAQETTHCTHHRSWRWLERSNVPRRCYLRHQLMFGYRFRQAGFLGTSLHTKAREKPSPITRPSATAHSWIRKGIQRSLVYLSHNVMLTEWFSGLRVIESQNHRML